MSFSVKQFLIDNKLADEKGNFLQSEDQIENPDWSIRWYDSDRAKIYFCTLIHFFEEHCMLEGLAFSINEENDKYELRIEILDKDLPDFRWDVVLDTIQYLLPFMAGSNISYLADGLFFEGK